MATRKETDPVDVFGAAEGGDMPPDAETEDAAMDEFLGFAREAFPDKDEEELRALKHAIEVCVDNTVGGAY